MTENKISIYQQFNQAGAEIHSYNSDMYVFDTKENREILSQHSEIQTFSSFRDNVTGKRMIDIPFAFDPWWDAS
jgi:hypothetical protein